MISWKNVLDFIASAGLKILAAGVLLAVGLFLIKYLIKLILKSRGFKKLDASIQGFLKGFISISLKTILIISVVSVLGVPLTSVLAAFASAGLAIGLALQGALSNLAGGFMILIFKPFKTGDYIDNGTHEGTVESITIFYTKLVTIDNKLITIPNKSIIETALTNYSAKDTRRIDLKFRAPLDCDIEKVKRILYDIAFNHPLTLKDPLPFARVYSHKDNWLEFVLKIWTPRVDYWTVYYDIIEEVKKQFDKEGITIPYQQLEVHINQKR
ncbi:MAG TPA: mechanosensitive ion channel domain-containing protein [Clostridia bacterium]